MIVLVTGGRSYTDQKRIFSVLDQIDLEVDIELVIQGGAAGADEQARLWAIYRERPSATYHAHWATLGKSAGPLRNEWMLEYGRPGLVIAFPGGTGTAHMVSLARKAGIETRLIEK